MIRNDDNNDNTYDSIDSEHDIDNSQAHSNGNHADDENYNSNTYRCISSDSYAQSAY